MEKQIHTLRDPVRAYYILAHILWPMIKATLMAGNRLVIELREENRTLKENALLHALLSVISQHLEWAGKKRDTETWKRLLTAAWCRARNEHIEMLPAVDGLGVDLVFRRTSQLTKAECAELIEYVYAWGCQQDVHFPDSEEIEQRRQLRLEGKKLRLEGKRKEVIDAETGEILEVA
jgi:NinB protein